MSSQIIKNKIPYEILYDFLEQICTKQKKFYIIDDISFKKAMYNNLLTEFYDNIKPFYFNSKKYYLEREKTYNYFTTIIRQICKKNTYHLHLKLNIVIQIIIYDTLFKLSK